MAQRLQLAKAAKADGSGNATFTFDVVPNGYVWIGSLSCQGAPPSAMFSPSVSGTKLASWLGAAGAPSVEAHGMETLTVTASGLAKNTQYLMTWNGQSYDAGTQLPDVPPPNIVALQSGDALDLLASLTLTSGANTYSKTFTPSATKIYSSLVAVLNPDPTVGDATLPLCFEAFDDVTEPLTPRYTAPFGVPTYDAGGVANPPGYQAQIPFGHEVGDALIVFVFFNTGTTANWSLDIFGLTLPPSNPARSDGRTYPIGGQPAAVSPSSNPQTLIPASPVGGLTIMLKTLTLVAGASGNLIASGTLQGTAIDVMAAPSAGVGSEVFESGLVFDKATAVTVRSTGTIGGKASATFDYVPAG